MSKYTTVDCVEICAKKKKTRHIIDAVEEINQRLREHNINLRLYTYRSSSRTVAIEIKLEQVNARGNK